MRKALLVGFRYSGNQKLPGILIDLYLVYNFLKKNEWDDSEICILTDIKHDHQTNVLRSAILDKTVKTDILSFIKDIKKREQYIHYQSDKYYNNFIKNLPQSVNLFYYYTGHCKNNNYVLPNDALVDFPYFLSHLKKYKQVILLLDACELSINLAYRFIDGVYRFENEVFYSNHILCLSSSSEKEKSIAHIKGSFFSKYIINILENRNLKISDIMNETEKENMTSIKINSEINSKINIKASYPILYLFSWLYSKTDLYILKNTYNLKLIY